ncbi:hypothetical protein Rhal01_02679 [Rubritalea halochordaticola]|uniref:Transmembrane protein n=1 Tax=Rubritalea halochordaticola TaxID=714537 RepID=A0ABP9V395_9BACT
MDPSSPYALPESAKQATQRDPNLVYTDGTHLVVPPIAELPYRCIGTNESMGMERKTETLVVCPRWLNLIRFLFFPLYLIMMLGSTRRCKVSFSYLPQVNHGRQWFYAIVGVLCTINGSLLMYTQWGDWGWKFVLGAFLLSGGLSLILESRLRLRAKESQHGWFFIQGCSLAFLQEVERLESLRGAVVLPSE